MNDDKTRDCGCLLPLLVLLMATVVVFMAANAPQPWLGFDTQPGQTGSPGTGDGGPGVGEEPRYAPPAGAIPGAGRGHVTPAGAGVPGARPDVTPDADGGKTADEEIKPPARKNRTITVE